MGKLTFDISMSVDGFIAGPNMRPDQGLGEGGERLHEWAYGLKAFREPHGESGGEVNADSEVLEEVMQAPGAIIMGRRMFGGGAGPWGEDPAWGDEPWEGWWGDEPPFFKPVFVLTHHEREPLVKGQTTFTFVTGGIESALEQAQAAGDGNVAIGGGADVIQQYLSAGLVDDFQVHVTPIFLGQGIRLFDDSGSLDNALEIVRVVDSPAATHLRYRVVK